MPMFSLKKLVPKVGVEPTRGCPHRFLRPARLPFRHFGVNLSRYMRMGLPPAPGAAILSVLAGG